MLSRRPLHGRGDAFMQGWRMHCMLTKTGAVSVQAFQFQAIMYLHLAAVYVHLTNLNMQSLHASPHVSEQGV